MSASMLRDIAKQAVLISCLDTVWYSNVMLSYSKILLYVCGYKGPPHLILWQSMIPPFVCVWALLHNHISKGACECLCVRAESHGGLTQAEDPVKCFIFRCVKLLHFLLLLCASPLGLPSVWPISTADKDTIPNTIWMCVILPAVQTPICKWNQISLDERNVTRPIEPQ